MCVCALVCVCVFVCVCVCVRLAYTCIGLELHKQAFGNINTLCTLSGSAFVNISHITW